MQNKFQLKTTLQQKAQQRIFTMPVVTSQQIFRVRLNVERPGRRSARVSLSLSPKYMQRYSIMPCNEAKQDNLYWGANGKAVSAQLNLHRKYLSKSYKIKSSKFHLSEQFAEQRTTFVTVTFVSAKYLNFKRNCIFLQFCFKFKFQTIIKGNVKCSR